MKNLPVWILLFSIAVLLYASYFIAKNKTRERIHTFVKSKRSLVVLILGQSNAANYCEELNRSDKNIYMYFQKRIYRAEDPILGATGAKGSIWIPVFETLLETKDLDSILIVNIAKGSSSVKEWQPDGIYGDQLRSVLLGLKEEKLEPDIICWQQGEQDNLNGLSKENYKRAFRKIHKEITRFLDDTPILISTTSFHPRSRTPINYEIRAAQWELIEESTSLFSGPDTDACIKDCRYDGVHFSTNGMDSVSRDWVESISHLLDSNMYLEKSKRKRF